MEILRLSPVTIESIAKIVSDEITKGKLVIIPTDTAYAISTDALNEKSIMKVFEVKKRNSSFPISICVNSIEMASKYAYISEKQKKILTAFLPGPLTFILKKKDNIPLLLTSGLDKIGIRIPNSSFTTILSNYLSVPYTITSANLSGMGSSYTIEDIASQFGEDLHKIFSAVVESNEKLLGNISTVIDISEDKPKIVREGFVQGEEILNKIKDALDN